MRLYYGLLVVVALSAHVGGASAATDAAALSHSTTAQDNDLLTKRFLRREYATDEDDEERVISSTAVEKFASLFKTGATPKTLVAWARKQVTAKDAFERLKLGKAGDKLMDNANFNMWVGYTRVVAEDDPASEVLTVLKTRYTDSQLGAMVGAAKTATTSTTTDGAAFVENALMHTWLSSHYQPDDVFVILGLDTVGDKLLASPQFKTWTTFTKLYSSKNPKEKTSLIALLTKAYRDAGVVKIVEAAKKTPSTEEAAKRLEAEQVQLWLKNKKSPDDVFKWFKLNKAGEGLLENPQFAMWTKYLKLYNSEYPDKGTTVLKTLKTYYGDAGLYEVLDKSKTVRATKSMATKLQGEEIKAWRAEEKTPGDVFKFLALDKAGNDLFSNPRLTTWLKYSDDFFSRYSNLKNKDPIITIDPLREAYGDLVLTKMILAAKKDPSTLKMATRMEDELFKGWERSDSPVEVFKLLKLDTEGDHVFESALWPTFMQYMDLYQKAYPERQVTLGKTLKTYYGDSGLNELINKAKMVPATESIATKLQTQVHDEEDMAIWRERKKTPSNVFYYLALDRKGNNLFSDPRFTTWLKYSDDYPRKKEPWEKEVRVIITIAPLREAYGDLALTKMILAAKKDPSTLKIATRMEFELFRGWALSSSPDEVFKWLKLRREGDHVFESALWPTFTQYVNFYQKMYPERKVTMISALEKVFQNDGGFNNDEKLAKILLAAKANPKTEELATKLQAEQIQYWVTSREKPDELFGVLGLDEKLNVHIFSQPLFKIWTEYLNAFNAKYPNVKTYMIDIFRKLYGDGGLAGMLIEAKKIPSSEKIATSMQTSLLHKWVLEDKSVKQVRVMLDGGEVPTEATIGLLTTYEKMLKESVDRASG